MPGAFGHMIGVWICGRLYERIKKINLTRLMWAALLFGAIAPDADFLIEWTIEDAHPHRTFTHSFFTVVLSGIIAGILILLAVKLILLKRNEETLFLGETARSPAGRARGDFPAEKYAAPFEDTFRSFTTHPDSPIVRLIG